MKNYKVTGEQSPVSDYKIIHITNKRQLTIPKEFFDELGVGREAKCYIRNRALVIEPLKPRSFWDFSSEILKEVIEEGYQSGDILVEFEKRKARAEFAIKKMVEDAKKEIINGRGRPARDVFDELYHSTEEVEQ